MEGKKTKKNSKKGKKVFRKAKPKVISEVDDIDLEADNVKKAIVDVLVAKFWTPEEEVALEYEEINKKYPTGEISKQDFLEERKVGSLT